MCSGLLKDSQTFVQFDSCGNIHPNIPKIVIVRLSPPNMAPCAGNKMVNKIVNISMLILAKVIFEEVDRQ